MKLHRPRTAAVFAPIVSCDFWWCTRRRNSCGWVLANVSTEIFRLFSFRLYHFIILRHPTSYPIASPSSTLPLWQLMRCICRPHCAVRLTLEHRSWWWCSQPAIRRNIRFQSKFNVKRPFNHVHECTFNDTDRSRFRLCDTMKYISDDGEGAVNRVRYSPPKINIIIVRRIIAIFGRTGRAIIISDFFFLVNPNLDMNGPGDRRWILRADVVRRNVIFPFMNKYTIGVRLFVGFWAKENMGFVIVNGAALTALACHLFRLCFDCILSTGARMMNCASARDNFVQWNILRFDYFDSWAWKGTLETFYPSWRKLSENVISLLIESLLESANMWLRNGLYYWCLSVISICRKSNDHLVTVFRICASGISAIRFSNDPHHIQNGLYVQLCSIK